MNEIDDIAKNDGDGSSSSPEKSRALKAQYHDRINILKKAHKDAAKDNLIRALQGYSQYLEILAQMNDVKEKSLSPSIFDVEKDAAELLIISQVYWALGKAYDLNPKLHKESKRCLAQFVKFSLGNKFQYINSEMIRKYIKKKSPINIENFKEAYEQIQLNSQKCYIATFCFSDTHEVTNILRQFKRQIMNFSAGKKFVEIYYIYSPKVVRYCRSRPIIEKIFTYISRPILFILAKIIQKNIL